MSLSRVILSSHVRLSLCITGLFSISILLVAGLYEKAQRSADHRHRLEIAGLVAASLNHDLCSDQLNTVEQRLRRIAGSSERIVSAGLRLDSGELVYSSAGHPRDPGDDRHRYSTNRMIRQSIDIRGYKDPILEVIIAGQDKTFFGAVSITTVSAAVCFAAVCMLLNHLAPASPRMVQAQPAESELISPHNYQREADELQQSAGALTAYDSEGEQQEPDTTALACTDPNLRSSDELFVVRLHETTRAMVCAARTSDYEQLASLTHWLAGSGAAAGVDELTGPAKELEQLVNARADDSIIYKLGEIIELTRHVRLPEEPVFSSQFSGPPIYSTLPLHDPDYRELVELFVTRLHDNMRRMMAAARQGSHEEICEIAHWLKGSGPCAGFEELYEPARRLESSARKRDDSSVVETMGQLIELTQRITARAAPCSPG